MTPSDSTCTTLRRPQVFLTFLLLLFSKMSACYCQLHPTAILHHGEEILNHFKVCPGSRQRGSFFNGFQFVLPVRHSKLMTQGCSGTDEKNPQQNSPPALDPSVGDCMICVQCVRIHHAFETHGCFITSCALREDVQQLRFSHVSIVTCMPSVIKCSKEKTTKVNNGIAS